MIWYKSSIQERPSQRWLEEQRWLEDRRFANKCVSKLLKCLKTMFLKERGRYLDILPSTVHSIIKRFKECRGISVRKGQGRKPNLNKCDLRSFRRHCIKNRHLSISDITIWAQEYFSKPLPRALTQPHTMTDPGFWTCCW